MEIMVATFLMTTVFILKLPLIDEGKPDTKSMNIDFGLHRDFACSYFDKALRASGKDPDY
jgi:hypothetical protein